MSDKDRERIMVTLNKEQYKILKELDFYGRNDAEKMTNIFISFVSLLKLKEGFNNGGHDIEHTKDTR